MIPVKLRLRNYCQHRDVTLDFTKGPVFALVAPNGAGKSNLLNGFRAALTGKMSASAKRIEDDIFHSANIAIIEAWFTQESGGKIYVKREFRRKGANSTELILESASGAKEEIVKTGAANQRFEELLKVNPDTLCEAVIAHQRSIEELLFAPASKRLERFQQFWHGDTFANLTDTLDKERETLFIDIHLHERIAKLNTEKTAIATQLAAYETALKDLLSQQAPDVIAPLKAKALKAHLFSELKLAYNNAFIQHATQEQARNKLIQALSELPPTLQTEAQTLAGEIKAGNTQNNILTTYESLNQTIQAQVKAQQTKELQLAQTLVGQAEQKEKVANLNWLNYTLKASKLATSITELGKQLEDVERKITGFNLIKTHKVKRQQDIQTPATGFGIAHYTSLLSMLQTSLNLADMLTHSHTHDANESCPVCLRKLDASLDVAKIKSHIEEVKAILTPLQADLAAVTAQVDQLNSQIFVAENTRNQYQQQLASLKADQTHLVPVADASPAFIAYSKTLTVEQTQGLLMTTTMEASKLTQTESSISTLQSGITSHKEIIADYQTRLKAIVLTSTVRVNVEELEAKLTVIQSRLAQHTSLLTQLGQLTPVIQQYKQELTRLETSRVQQGLPSFSDALELTDIEQAQIKSADELEANIVLARSSLVSQQQLQVYNLQQLASSQKEIEVYEQTVAYEKHLKEMSRIYKVLPQQIIRSQLKSLCTRIDAIISVFKLHNPFKLELDEDFGFLLSYPSGAQMPILRASGGERIILGLAFRLAAHKALAPEMPFLAIDEPTNHLDEVNQEVLANLIDQLSSNLKLFGLEKLLITTHSAMVSKKANTIITL